MNWNSVKDRLPEESDYYLIAWLWDDHKVVGEGYWNMVEWLFPLYSKDKDMNYKNPIVTDWMPLPSPPKEDE